jgi:hypothetical protein
MTAAEIVSLRASTTGKRVITPSMVDMSVGEKLFVEVTSTSAVINARASLPTTFVRFCINDLSATIEPTPNAMQRKKNKSRRHEERISRRVRLKMNFIGIICRKKSTEYAKKI